MTQWIIKVSYFLFWQIEPQVHEKRHFVSSPVASSDEADDETEDEREVKSPPKTWIDYCTYAVYFLFWATLYAIAIQLKFGAVFFMFSCLIGIYLNTRTGPKLENEPSAYSVFNPNMESIDGTLKAEQFEREIGVRIKWLYYLSSVSSLSLIDFLILVRQSFTAIPLW